jgi:hypothetical protein
MQFLFLARSSWSRAYDPVMEIGDLSEKESKDYLTKSCKECKITDEQVNELYKLVGGRIVDLKAVSNKLLTGESIEGKVVFIIFASNKFM